MFGVKSLSKYKEASAGGGSFAPQGGSFALQGGLISRQNLAIHVIRTTCSQLVPIFHQSGFNKTTGGP